MKFKFFMFIQNYLSIKSNKQMILKQSSYKKMSHFLFMTV